MINKVQTPKAASEVIALTQEARRLATNIQEKRIASRKEGHKMTQKFTAEQFTPTKWSTAADKAKFANHFVRFAMSDCKETIFPQWFYRRLSNCFGHIAHYNQAGFYNEWFLTSERKRDFFRNVVQHPIYGDPAYTYSDVERQLAEWVDRMGFAADYQDSFNKEVEAQERLLLAKLTAKYALT